MPAEWERHEATWLSWPKDTTTFPGDALRKVETLYVDMIEALSEGELVNVLVDDQVTEDRVASVVRASPNIRFHRITSVDVWVRDYGPIFAKDRDRLIATKWRFNAWGNKYDDLLFDDLVGLKIAELTGNEVFQPGIVLEGGSIDVNGKGTLLTTEQCLLNRNRNPGLSRDAISSYLNDYLGAKNVIWLESGIAGDDTDGHVDDLARFVSIDTVLCASEDDVRDENYGSLKRNHEILGEARNKDGRGLKIVRLPMPKRRVEYDGSRLPASYANFYIGNSAVLVPTYDDQNDDTAIKVISRYFPSRKIIELQSEALVQGFGSIHCVTQQQPA